MKKQFIIVVLSLAGLTVFGQPSKTPVKKPVPVAVANNKPPLSFTKTAIMPLNYKYSSDNGHVDVSYARSKNAVDNTTSTSSPAKSAMCLTKEEVRGQRIENEQVIADGAKALQILPGGVIDADILLKSGEFRYIKMDQRKQISLSTTSNLARKVSQTVTPRGNNNIEDDLRAKVHELTRPSNIIGMPNVKSSSEVSISTLDEKTGLNVGASLFYMGVSADNNFRFTSEKYHYMYLYQFEQECLPVIANTITSAADVFTDNSSSNNNWLYIREVKYGRRLYVFIESEYDLAKYADELNGKLNWEVVKAKLSVSTKTSSLSSQTNVKIITQGGQPIGLTDQSKLQATLDDYFATPFREMDIVPLSYKLTYLDGTPVSIVSNAFLDGKNCLSSSTAKVRVSKIEVVKGDDSNKDVVQELYGSANINYYDENGRLVAIDGKSPIPSLMPTTAISYGSKEAAITVSKQSPKEFPADQQGKYRELILPSLDVSIEIKPGLHEKDNVLNKDDDYTTEDRFKMSLRRILTEGNTNPWFEFRRKEAVIKIYFEITAE
jgi:hypothetical protein